MFREYVPSCPSGEHFHFESYFASGRIRIAQGIASGTLEWDSSMLLPIFACTTCGNCEVQCLAPHKEHIVEMIEELRVQAVAAIGALPEHVKFRERVETVHNPYGAEHHNRMLVKTLGLPEKAEYVYFIGCTSNYRETSIRDATISVLQKAGVDYTIVDEHCCGSPLLRTGQRAAVFEVAKHNVTAIEESGAKRVVTSCAGCYRTLTKDYPRLGLEINSEVIHITQLLSELFRNNKLNLKIHESDTIATFHDPCHLGRACNIYDEPRDVISELPITLVEMELTRENAWCCGAGGGVKSAFGDWSVETASKRIEHARDTGSQILISACPFCVRNLQDACSDNSLEILDLVELVDRMT